MTTGRNQQKIIKVTDERGIIYYGRDVSAAARVEDGSRQMGFSPTRERVIDRQPMATMARHNSSRMR